MRSSFAIAPFHNTARRATQTGSHHADKANVESSLEREVLVSRYAHLSRYVNDAVLLIDEDGHVLEANDRAVTLYGYSADELLEMTVYNLLDPTLIADHPALVKRLLEDGGALFESVHRRKDGSPVAVEISSRVVEIEGRRLRQSIVRDITERKCADEQLQRAIRAMRVLSASNQALVRSADEDSLFRSICAAATAIGGYPLAWIGFAEDNAEKTVRVVAASGPGVAYLDSVRVSWADEPLGRGPVGTCIRSGQIAIFNDLEANPDFEPWRTKANWYGYRSAISLPLTSSGVVIGALTINASEPDAFHDDEVELLKELAGDLSYGIESHRRSLSKARTEEALLDAALEFRTLFNTANESIFIVDLEGHFLEVNRVACDRLGYRREELLSMEVADIVSPALPHELLLTRRGRIIQEGELLFEAVHIAKDGAELPVEISTRLFDYRGSSSILCVARDIRERKRLEAAAHKQAAELERAKTAAENASRAKSQFVANMSHEIRTPMNGILGMSGMLLETTLQPEQREYAETIGKSAEALLGIVNDVLDFSKIEAGRMKIELLRFDIVTCLAEVGDLLTPQICSKGLNYTFATEVDHRIVHGDAGRIRQIVLNLLWNAIKFTERGHVKLCVAETHAESDRPTFSISVEDTGVGIAALDVALIFDTFSQVDSSTTKRHGGTGLGLAISQRLAGLMGADITVTSELGRGSAFTLSIPLPVESAPPASHQPPGASRFALQQRRRRILLAEDNSVNQKIGARLLEKCGCHVDLAANGKEALDMAARFPYDLILMDCGMPEMDGFEAARAIRSCEQSRAHLPIVALTAHVMDGTRDQCLASGMDDYLAKPVSLEAIERMLLQWSP
jgi:PAS domain S-box-containing protein